VSKVKVAFVCQNCGYHTPKWVGRCPDCEQWNTFAEEIEARKSPVSSRQSYASKEPRSIAEISVSETFRIKSNIAELDRVLGGGLVPGSAVLVGGQPGIGKSTLLLQVADSLSRRGRRILYVSGEESISQTKLRANRLGTASKELYLVNELNSELIIEYIKKFSPSLVVIDSIQVVYNPVLSSSPGSVSQVRECAAGFIYLAKATGVSIVLVGHVTKEGVIAGPRVLEHMVDTVLYFEGERHTSFRILRAVKNRFGSTNEIGVFQMTSGGLKEVVNPSQFLIEQRPGEVGGTVVVPCIEGTRPILVEIQSLVGRSNLALPRRWSSGIDYNRVSLLVAVLEKRAGLSLYNQDVFVNAAGGVKITEPAADLGIALAISSSLKEKVLKQNMAVVGEIGLTGEVRAVSQIQPRIKEVQKLGFSQCLIPENNLKGLAETDRTGLIGVKNLRQAIKIAVG
jgi:DNA repair protein RadA/Sms